MVIRKVLAVAVLLPLMAASSWAQAQSGDHHYQGGPKTEVPHHIGPKATGTPPKSRGTRNQAGQHHYQGGPQSAVPHHIGDPPKATGDAPKRRGKAKRKKGSQG